MDLPRSDQDNISRLQSILLSLDHIAHISRKENQQLVKIVIMKGDLPLSRIHIMKQAEILPQIS